MSSTQTNTTEAAGLAEVAAAIRDHDRFIVTTHENPDGDALGSLLAMTLALRELGKDAVMYLFGEVPIPKEYEFMKFAGLARGHRELQELLDGAERYLGAQAFELGSVERKVVTFE